MNRLFPGVLYNVKSSQAERIYKEIIMSKTGKKEKINLTEGSPFRVIMQFTLPVIGGNLFQLFYTLADSVIVGKTLGTSSLAAVGATSIIVYFVLCFIQGMTNGFGIYLGQKAGEGKLEEIKKELRHLCG